MKHLHFDYRMQLAYSEQVKKCHFTIKCIPPDTARQKITNLQLVTSPTDSMEQGTDSFGNRFLFGNVLGEHDRFFFHATGDACTGLADSEPFLEESLLGAYKYPYGRTCAGTALKRYWKENLHRQEETMYRQAYTWMKCLYRDFAYEKEVTAVDTTAEQAWCLGRGVCQDYAHILITLCRLSGIPARYVVGMMLGEGFSHAWVEILSDGRWYALDPTNGCAVDDSYIKLGVGRDASDCSINRGVMLGGGRQSQDICVTVTENKEEE